MNETELIQASSTGNLLRVQQILTSGPNTEYRDGRGCTSLHLAAEAGHLEVVQLLVDSGAQIESTMILHGTSINFTPVAAAASRGHMEIVRFLAEKGAILYERDGYMGYFSVMTGAVASGDLPTVRYLREEKKLPVNEANEGGITPLHVAIEKSHEHMVAYLIEQGADPEFSGKIQPSPLAYVQEKLKSSNCEAAMKAVYSRMLAIMKNRARPSSLAGNPDARETPSPRQESGKPRGWLWTWMDRRKAKSLVKKNDWLHEAAFLLEDHSLESKKLVLDHLNIWLPMLETAAERGGNLPKAELEAARARIDMLRKAVTMGKGLVG